jgi:hypothetical protein
MSSREKRLLLFLSIAGFIVLNLFGYKQYDAKCEDFRREKAAATQALRDAKLFRDSSQHVAAEMDWLAAHEPPQSAAAQDIQNTLQQLAVKEAEKFGLEVKRQKLMPADETQGNHYNRAKVEFVVNGKEDALYKWLDSLHSPDQLRAVTSLRLSPDRDDDTKIDCTVVVDQWFVPQAPSA